MKSDGRRHWQVYQLDWIHIIISYVDGLVLDPNEGFEFLWERLWPGEVQHSHFLFEVLLWWGRFKTSQTEWTGRVVRPVVFSGALVSSVAWQLEGCGFTALSALPVLPLLCACVGSLLVLQLPPTHTHARPTGNSQTFAGVRANSCLSLRGPAVKCRRLG